MAAIKVIVAGGGTGGHLYPGIAIVEALRDRKPDIDVMFVSAGTSSEEKVLADANIAETKMPMEKLHRYFTWRLLLVPFSLFRAIGRAKKLVREFEPDVIVGMGGFVTGPMGLAASKYNVPLVLCEQNCYPGLSNRKLAGKAALVLSAFAGAQEYLPQDVPFAVIGNPSRAMVRRSLTTVEARRALNLDEDAFTVVSTGGSGGARSLTMGLITVLRRLKDEYAGMQVLIQCRKENQVQVQAELDSISSLFRSVAFFEDVGAVYAAADVAVLRAGGGMFEVLGRGVPTVLVPYPYAAADHQRANAQEAEASGAAVVVEEGDGFPERLYDEMKGLINNEEQKERMREDALKMSKWGAAEAAAQAILDMSEGKPIDLKRYEALACAG